MDEQQLKTLIGNLLIYFGRKKRPSDDQVKQWLDELEWIPGTDDILGGIEKIMRQADNLLGNLPKKIKAAYYEYKKSRPVPITYDLEDDPRFPIQKLWTALDILENSGREAFYEYCATCKMPMADRERVLAKFNKVYADGDANKLAENVGVHTNPGERARQDVIPF